MTRYALVDKGAVIKTGGLPRNTGKISGFDKLSNEKLKAFGYFPYTYIAPVFNPLIIFHNFKF
jgi:hypothetical protein